MTPAQIVPEWYYLPFYAILRAIPDKLMGVIALFGLDHGPGLPALARHLARALGALPAAVQAVLLALRDRLHRPGLARLKPPEGIYVILARIFTVYYFAFFLIVMPLLGIFEKTKPLPNSISESVLGAKA